MLVIDYYSKIIYGSAKVCDIRKHGLLQASIMKKKEEVV